MDVTTFTRKRREELLATMPMEIDGVKFYDMGEAAEFLGYSRTQAQIAIKKYEDEQGREVRMKNGQTRLVSEKDLAQILIARKPFEARRRGLIKE